MKAEKTVAVSFRVSPHFKSLLEMAAARERRSQTNMLETLLFDYCEQRGIKAGLPELKHENATTK
jgi:predicted transcriptional regulator